MLKKPCKEKLTMFETGTVIISILLIGAVVIAVIDYRMDYGLVDKITHFFARVIQGLFWLIIALLVLGLIATLGRVLWKIGVWAWS